MKTLILTFLIGFVSLCNAQEITILKAYELSDGDTTLILKKDQINSSWNCVVEYYGLTGTEDATCSLETLVRDTSTVGTLYAENFTDTLTTKTTQRFIYADDHCAHSILTLKLLKGNISTCKVNVFFNQMVEVK